MGTRGSTRSVVAATLLLSACDVQADEIVRNWFNDPFFQVRAGIASCPMPPGPYVTEEQRLKETHYRSERGTRCWLEPPVAFRTCDLRGLNLLPRS